MTEVGLGGNSGIDGPELNWRRRRRCHRNFLVLQLGHSKFGGGQGSFRNCPWHNKPIEGMNSFDYDGLLMLLPVHNFPVDVTPSISFFSAHSIVTLTLG